MLPGFWVEAVSYTHLDDIIKRADSLMYQSKNNGRNMVSTDVSAENA